MKKLFLLLILMGMIFGSIAAAAIPVTVDSKGTTFIQWSWTTGDPLTNISIDGYEVCSFDHNAANFILSGLNPNETHSIAVYTASDSGSNTTTTLPAQETQQESFFGDMNNWIFLIIIIVIFYVASKTHWVFFWLGSGIAAYGLYRQIQATSPILADISHIWFFVYLCLLLLGVLLWFLAFKKRKW